MDRAATRVIVMRRTARNDDDNDDNADEDADDDGTDDATCDSDRLLGRRAVGRCRACTTKQCDVIAKKCDVIAKKV